MTETTLTRCDYCYHERATEPIQVAGLSGFTVKRICAECTRKYARPVSSARRAKARRPR